MDELYLFSVSFVNMKLSGGICMNNIYVFWKRFFAFVIDSTILGIVGAMLCFAFHNQLLAMGNFATLIGFVLFLLYYGIQNSVLCKGQTIGKRIFKIKIVSENGEYLTLFRSILRSFILTPILIFNNIIIPIGYVSFAWSCFVNCFSLAQILLFLVNRPTRQLLHDLIVKSVCINANSEITEKEKTNFKVILSIVISIILSIVIPIIFLSKTSNAIFNMIGMNLQEFNNLQQEVKQSINVKLVGVNANYFKNFNTNKVTSTIIYTIAVPKLDIKDTKLCADYVIKLVSTLSKSNNNNLNKFDEINVTIIQNINTGIFRVNESYWQRGTMQQWSERINNSKIK